MVDRIRSAVCLWRQLQSVVGALILVGVVSAVPEEKNSDSPQPQNSAESRALAATVRLRVQDDKGESFGTGTIVDRHGDEVLVLTCGHIFREAAKQSHVLCDLFTTEAVEGVPGKIVSYDLRRDVGLVSLRPGIKVEPIPVGGGGFQAKEGNSVFTLGCSKGANPTVMAFTSPTRTKGSRCATR